MWPTIICFGLIFAVFGHGQDVRPHSDPRLAEGEKKMSEQLLQILEHYKKRDPVGLPGAKIPDPYPVPDMKQSLSFATVHFKNTAVYGISKFRIVDVNVEVGAMEVHASMMIDKLIARGNYTMVSWFQKASGPYNVDITGLKILARANLGVERDGKLQAQNMHIDLAFSTINVNFQNLGFFGAMVQGMINGLGSVIFDAIKPFVLKEAYAKGREEINKNLEKVAGDMQFPNSISPLDIVIADLRKQVRDTDKDPYQVMDYNTTVSVFAMSLTRTWLIGLSSFHRVGAIILKMENNTVIADFEIGTQKLEGSTQWEITAVSGLMSRAGIASFSVEYVSGRIVLAQPLDTRKKPEFRGLDLDVGNIQVRCDGAGTLDYVIEFAVNILPNLLRYQIMDAMEGTIREKAQQALNKVNVEEVIKQNLPKLDQVQETGFKLSQLHGEKSVEQPYDDDEFFNF